VDFAAVWEFLVTLDITTVFAACCAILLLCGLGLPVPEDITLVTMGYMIHRLLDSVPGVDSRVWAAAGVGVGLFGVLAGDAIMFSLGRRFGSLLLDRWPFKSLFGHGRADRARTFLQSHGPKVLFSARFMPGLRSVVFFTSGTLGIPLRTFLFYDGMAALLSVPALVLSAWYWGDQIDAVIAKAQAAEHGILAVIVAVALLLAGKWWLDQRKKAKEAAQ
jgi:membrane protein DedA with SNARE-associated domain